MREPKFLLILETLFYLESGGEKKCRNICHCKYYIVRFSKNTAIIHSCLLKKKNLIFRTLLMFLQPLHHELLADQSFTKHKVRFLLGHSLCYQLWKFGRTEMYLVLLYVAYNKLWGRYSLIEYITIILCFWTAIVAILWLPIVTNWVVPKNSVHLLSFDFFVGEMEQSLEKSWQYH